MQVTKIPFAQTGSFANLFLDYVAEQDSLRDFYAWSPKPAGFAAALKHRSFPDSHRQQLVAVLKEQYEGLEQSPLLQENIDLLGKKNTFTVTTGHQLNIFTGPLFFLYKIITTINICRELSRQHPDYHFVPVYWMGSEDHDLEEINHIFIDGQKYEWHTGQTGAVGRMQPAGLAELAAELPGRTAVFTEAYSKMPTLAAATRYYVNALLGDTGLVVLDPDHRQLKRQFWPVVQQELTGQVAYKEVEKQNKQLHDAGYKPHLNPREINLFYLDEGLRERIDKQGEFYVVNNTSLRFSEQEILALARQEPEKFSPNVILRPVYQETILPNLGYVGGPSELSYWLQFKKVFAALQVDFPVLMPRNFCLYLNKNAQRKIMRLGLTVEDLFLPLPQLQKKYVKEHSAIDLNEARQAIEQAYAGVRNQAADIDITLVPHVEGRLKKHLADLDRIETKMVRAVKRQQQQAMQRLAWLKEYAFPGGIPQERYLNYLAIPEADFLDQVQQHTDPFDLRMHVLHSR